MFKLLIADDNESALARLADALRGRGYAVETAVGGRETIDLGCRYRPRVLIVNFMLADRIHGLQAAAALRLVCPDLAVVLTSNFVSTDLAFEAGLTGVSQVVAKPFTTERIEQAIAAASNGRPESSPSKVGFAEITVSGEILYASPRTAELLEETSGGRRARSLRQVLPREDWAKLDHSTREWVEMRPLADRPLAWQVRSRRPSGLEGFHCVLVRGDDCLVFLEDEGEHYPSQWLVHWLLALRPATPRQWPCEGRALIVHSSDMLRRLAAMEIERVGGLCHTAESCQVATRVLKSDSSIEIVVLDGCLLGPYAEELLGRIRAGSGDVVILGQGSEDMRQEFALYGIDCVLPRVWQAADLIHALQREIQKADSRRQRDSVSSSDRTPDPPALVLGDRYPSV